jgi:hypothetical protein
MADVRTRTTVHRDAFSEKNFQEQMTRHFEKLSK